MESNDNGLNIEILYEIYQGTFRQEKYEPKSLHIDLLNLESVGYITCTEDKVEITAKGKHDMEVIMNELLDANE